MIVIMAKWIVLLFGYFIIFIAFLMLFAPKVIRATLRKAGSTNFINYAEITIRIIPAAAMIMFAEFSKVPLAFESLGIIMLFTSFALYLVPRKTHHSFSNKSADILKPICFQLISPFALLIGILIIFNAI